MSSQNSTERLRKQRIRFWNEDPHCYWCGIETVLDLRNGSGGKFSPNSATIDHLRPRHHPLRHEPAKPDEIRRVLSCWQCNNDRDHVERQLLPKEWFYERGCGKPMSMKSTEQLKGIAQHLQKQLPHRNSRDRRKIQINLQAVQDVILQRETQEYEQHTTL